MQLYLSGDEGKPIMAAIAADPKDEQGTDKSCSPIILSPSTKLSFPLGILGDPKPLLQAYHSQTHGGIILLSAHAYELPGPAFSAGIRIAPKQNIRALSAHELQGMGMHEAADALMSIAKEWPAAFLIVDLSILDPVYAASAIQEPGGLSTRELLYLIKRIKKLRNFAGFSLSGIPHKLSMGDLTAKTTAKLAKELL
ncbi:MAG: arginase family protein [Nanoarchaeota archaeon]